MTWKVADNIYQHIDVLEKNKMNAFSLGQSLWIDKEEFEDLDEIIARYINPMAACARELLTYKYYKDTEGGKVEIAEKVLREEQEKNPKKIHYIFSVCSVIIIFEYLKIYCFIMEIYVFFCFLTTESTWSFHAVLSATEIDPIRVRVCYP